MIVAEFREVNLTTRALLYAVENGMFGPQHAANPLIAKDALEEMWWTASWCRRADVVCRERHDVSKDVALRIIHSRHEPQTLFVHTSSHCSLGMRLGCCP